MGKEVQGLYRFRPVYPLAKGAKEESDKLWR